MKKTVCKREYDTQTAKLIKRFTAGDFGNPQGYEEALYQTEDGLYFLYVNGGDESPYRGENIKAMSKSRAAEWLETHGEN